MTGEEYKSTFDPSFDENVFITKANNIVIKYFNSITMRDIDKYDHFFADDLFNKGKEMIAEAEANGSIRMFDELNIRFSRINRIEYDDNFYYAYVNMNILYMDYFINKASGVVVKGDNHTRVPHQYIVVFAKSRTAKEQVLVKTCPTCGASLNPNSNGICEYCHTVYNQEDHDWVLLKIDGFNN